MTKTNKEKIDLLDHFYEYLTEDDWLEGVDLYQSGKVTNVKVYHGLITGKVAPMVRAGAEVRLKIHPSGRAIQWIECTCPKNRKYGYYCEHIAAFMLHNDREKNEFFENLDVKMPIKPPIKPKNSNQKPLSSNIETSEVAKGEATQKVLDHLQGSISSISLLAHGPKIRVRMEIKEGTLTNYDLDIDAAANFLKTNASKAKVSPELHHIKISTSKAELGTRIFQDDDEKITTERVIAIRLKQPLTDQQIDALRIETLVEKQKKISLHNIKGKEGLYQFISLKNGGKYLGEKFFFLPGIGYFEIEKNSYNSTWSDLPLHRTFKQDQAAKLIERNFEEFIQAGTIWLDSILQITHIIETPSLTEIKVHSENNGWFYLDPKYGTGKSAVSMAELRSQYRGNRREYFKSGDTWLKIPEFITNNEWDLDQTGQYLKVDTLGLMRLKANLGELDKFVGSKKILNNIRNKIEFDPENVKPEINNPNLNLREYQQTGVKWLWWLYQNHLHGLLADDMGLGKTHQTMALLCAIIQKEKKDCKFLVICPTSVIDHWEDKINEFSPVLNPIKFHGSKRKRPEHSITHTVITSYGILLRDAKKLSEENWDAIILDEAHYVKNNNTSTYKAACQIPSRIRVCLSGTPMENHLMELKNIFDFLIPGYLGSDVYFKKNFISPIEQQENPEQEFKLQKLIYPFKLRRTKAKVLNDLPDKLEEIRHCTLSDEQIKLYRDVIQNKAQSLIKQLESDEKPAPFLHVFATLQLLKQICNHPALVTEGVNYKQLTSGKFELLKELVHEALGSDNKIVIFSQYVGMVNIICSYLEEKGIEYVSMTGQTRNRGKVIESFQKNENIKIFVGSLLAGGIGIDLTAASVVIHYDRWWNPSKENQATDRVHRIGQKNFVQVMKLVTKGTLEEKIDKIINSKKSTFEKFMEKDEEIFKTLSRQELINLLE